MNKIELCLKRRSLIERLEFLNYTTGTNAELILVAKELIKVSELGADEA